MSEAFICDAVSTPIGKLNGAPSTVRADDLAFLPIRALPGATSAWTGPAVDDAVLGCAYQAGEDNGNLTRMAVLLAGLPKEAPGVTVDRLCASGLDPAGCSPAPI